MEQEADSSFETLLDLNFIIPSFLTRAVLKGLTLQQQNLMFVYMFCIGTVFVDLSQNVHLLMTEFGPPEVTLCR